MITAIDTSVLLDVFGADPTHGTRSAQSLRQCIAEGRLVACEVVWAEVTCFFPSEEAVSQAMGKLGIEFAPMDRESSLLAGAAFRRYRARGGRRTRVAADFLIGAHAAVHADRLLTRDRGFYKSGFGKLSLIDPSQN